MKTSDFLISKLSNLPVAAIARIAKNKEAERVGSNASAILVQKSEEYIVKEANKLATHAGRKTLKAEDIEMAAEKY